MTAPTLDPTLGTALDPTRGSAVGTARPDARTDPPPRSHPSHEHAPVFVDDGRRARWVSGTGWAVGLALAAWFVLSVGSVLDRDRVPRPASRGLGWADPQRPTEAPSGSAVRPRAAPSTARPPTTTGSLPSPAQPGAGRVAGRETPLTGAPERGLRLRVVVAAAVATTTPAPVRSVEVRSAPTAPPAPPAPGAPVAHHPPATSPPAPPPTAPPATGPPPPVPEPTVPAPTVLDPVEPVVEPDPGTTSPEPGWRRPDHPGRGPDEPRSAPDP